MSTNYNNMSDGQLWNVMLQRDTGSSSELTLQISTNYIHFSKIMENN